MLSLDDILAAPTDPEELNKHLIGRGLIPPPAEAIGSVPPATVGALSPVAPTVKPMVPPKADAMNSIAGALNPGEAAPLVPPKTTDWLARETHGLHPLRAEPSMDVSESPELGGATPGGGAGNIIKPIVPPAAPTGKESIAAGMALRPLSAKDEGKRQFHELRPQLTADPGSAEYSRQKLAQMEFDKLHPWGGDISAHPGLLGKIGHIAARVGNIAGDVLAPGVMANIPGTDINKQIEEADTKRELATRTGAEQEGVTKGLQQEEVKTRLAKEQNEQSLEKDSQGNVTGWTDAQGKKHSLEEEGTPQAIKDIAEASKSKTEGPRLEKTANGDIVQITTDKEGKATSNVVYKGQPGVKTETRSIVGADGKAHDKVFDITPGSANFGKELADLGRAKEDKQLSAAGELAKEKAGERLVQGVDDKGNIHLVPKAQADEMGLHHVAQATPGDRQTAENNTSALNEVGVKTRNLDSELKALDQGALQRSIIAYAMSHDTGGTMDSLMKWGAMKGASPQTQDFMVAAHNLREAVLSLPKVMTGTSRMTEVQAEALWKTIVNASAKDSKYGKKQLRALDEMVDRQWKKVPHLEGNPREYAYPEMHKEGGGAAAEVPAPPEGKASVYSPNGEQHFVKSDQLDKFLKDPKYKNWTKNAPR